MRPGGLQGPHRAASNGGRGPGHGFAQTQRRHRRSTAGRKTSIPGPDGSPMLNRTAGDGDADASTATVALGAHEPRRPCFLLVGSFRTLLPSREAHLEPKPESPGHPLQCGDRRPAPAGLEPGHHRLGGPHPLGRFALAPALRLPQLAHGTGTGPVMPGPPPGSSLAPPAARAPWRPPRTRPRPARTRPGPRGPSGDGPGDRSISRSVVSPSIPPCGPPRCSGALRPRPEPPPRPRASSSCERRSGGRSS